jgi:hypothetical protein
MALEDLGGSKNVYLGVADGRIVQSFKNETQGATLRVTKTGKQVWEKFYKAVTGVLVKIEKKTNDFGSQWCLFLQDGETTYVLNVPYSGRYGTSILKCLPNFNLQIPVSIHPWSMVDKNDASKKITGVSCYQSGKKVEPAFTKDNPNGLPQMRQVKVKGVPTWDDTEMLEFFEELVKKTFAKAPQPNVDGTDENNINDEDDLPF